MQRNARLGLRDYEYKGKRGNRVYLDRVLMGSRRRPLSQTPWAVCWSGGAAVANARRSEQGGVLAVLDGEGGDATVMERRRRGSGQGGEIRI